MNTSLSLPYITRPARKENAPLLLLLHGYGSNEEDLFSFAPEISEDIFIVSARAPYEMPPQGAAWYAINFDASGGKFSDNDQARESMVKITSFLEELKATYSIDPGNMNVLGFSQGAILAYGLSLSQPGLFQNVVAMSGYVNEDLIAGRSGLEARFRKSEIKTNYFISHGTVDQVIPYQWAKKAPQIMEEIHADYMFKEYPIGHGVSRDNFYDMKEWLEKRILTQ
ncbi:phospholipase [Nonlabens sp. Ci31]|uniref:alpha/beta hydrolase n=1 Tax=Nonlabens sp. Ci31 TaxID=2608253 RepID=UPI0014643803|nr:alpha/beta hydrolase-fold protein [Nonlabens sp. Ci31]QJP35134.1 phospholipase [Nonlabens sp. Ci31]